ncbi:hypothetical protein GVN15_00270 [Pseudomonas putida]|uniref:hypothetical protein n=1 Tax=Pseudomonas putida TaxID=303 RepID=UPI0013766C2D|nr:hypothetical protein [Pseudomonas putida]NBA79051.1 hypothetical protein [Pseudomonas putida]
MKDKIVWISCLLLFLAGVVWGRVTLPDNFYRVDSIHDLFDMLGGAATIVAVSVAYAGLNSWRRQGKAVADHELARKLIIALRIYQDEIIRNWTYAANAVSKIESNSWIGEGGRDNYLVGIYEEQLRKGKEAVAALEPLRLECIELWGSELDGHFFDMYEVDVELSDLIDKSLWLIIYGTFDDRSEETSLMVLNRWRRLSSQGLTSIDSVKSKITEMVQPLKNRAKGKLFG